MNDDVNVTEEIKNVYSSTADFYGMIDPMMMSHEPFKYSKKNIYISFP